MDPKMKSNPYSHIDFSIKVAPRGIEPLFQE